MTDNEERRLWLVEDDKKEFPHRLERLNYLIALQDGNDYSPFPNLTHFYYEEARRCWVMGCFLPTIMMVRLTFQDWLRSHFWGQNTNTLSSGIELQEAELSELIEEAVLTNYISKDEAVIMHHVDEDLYQPYARPIDKEVSEIQEVKLTGGNADVLNNIEEEAKEAITILSQNFSPMVMRTLGR